MRNPPEPSVRDHDEGPTSAAQFDTAPLSDVLAPPDRKDAFVGVEVATERDVAGVEKFSKGRHAKRSRSMSQDDEGSAPSTGNPASRHASKPPITSVARCRPSDCRRAAARLELNPSWQNTITRTS